MLRDINPVALRVPDKLKQLLQQVVDENKRSMSGNQSMNSEIVARLSASFDSPGSLSRVSTADLVRELLSRNEPGRICIEVSMPAECDKG
jgi:hypothetical protein